MMWWFVSGFDDPRMILMTIRWIMSLFDGVCPDVCAGVLCFGLQVIEIGL